MEFLIGIILAVTALAVAYGQGLKRGRHEGTAATLMEIRQEMASPHAKRFAQTLAHKEATGEWPGSLAVQRELTQEEIRILQAHNEFPPGPHLGGTFISQEHYRELDRRYGLRTANQRVAEGDI